MPPFQASDIGPVYDFGLATRDGLPIVVKNRRGDPVEMSSCAFMCSIDKNNKVKESTELQEKSQLIQFASSNLIDREFDQWPQITQGDWSGGTSQRVFGSNNVENQYWDGEGLLWPFNDYVPQKPMPGPALALPAPFGTWPYNGLAGGFLNGAGQGYAYATLVAGTNTTYIHFQTADTDYVASIVSTPNLVPMHLVVAGGFIWMLASGSTISAYVSQIGMVGGVLTFIRNDNLGIAGGAPGPISGILSATYVSNKLYVGVAVTWSDGAGPPAKWQSNLFVLDYSVPGAPPAGIGAPLAFPAMSTGTSGSAFRFTDIAWQGTTLVLAVSDGSSSTILNLNSPYTSVAVATSLGGLPNAFLCVVGAATFIVGYSYGANTQINRMDLFTLTGGVLTEFGSVIAPVPIMDSITSPVSFGGYAIWAVSYTLPGATTKTITIYAFDVTRSRLFRILSFSNAGYSGSDAFGHNAIAVFGATTRTIAGGASFQAQWGLAAFTGLISNNTETAREFYWGVVPIAPTPSFTGLLQMGTDLTSGLIDATAASNKLYRQVVVSWFGSLVLGSATPFVTLSLWFDQDPSSLSTVPDYTIRIDGTLVGQPLPSQLKLPINRIARKMVYRVISSAVGGGQAGGAYNGTQWISLPKIVSVATQLATGWVVDMMADLSPNVRTNSNNTQDYAYQKQGGPLIEIDHVAAYNFLKQLWRQKGGECIAYWPNQDTYPALIQSEDFESPKPFASQTRSDQQASIQNMVSIKIREDI